MRHISGHDKNKKGSSLAVLMILLPMVLSLYLVSLTHIEVLLREAKRIEQRAQAGLLAESGLHTLRASRGATMQGSINGAGIWLAEPVDGGHLKITGRVESPRSVCISEMLVQPDGGYAVINQGFRFESKLFN